MSVQHIPHQTHSQSLDISNWRGDEEHAVYPEGARDKRLVISPRDVPYKFLRPTHRYLYKLSSHRYPEQYWMEIFSYRLGCLIGVEVPPAFVSYDSQTGTSGALIEWYLGHSIPPKKTFNLVQFARPRRKLDLGLWVLYLSLKISAWLFHNKKVDLHERYAPGGDYLQRRILHFDRKRGTQHNFETIAALCEGFHKIGLLDGDWVEYWTKVFVFDALIGNTDRHQDNWGFIWFFRGLEQISVCLAPVFDNGTSMGHEIRNEDLHQFGNYDRLVRYVRRGKHHMKWRLHDQHQISHSDLIALFLRRFPNQTASVSKLLQFKTEDLKNILQELCAFDCLTPLSKERAAFMEKLVLCRQAELNNIVENL